MRAFLLFSLFILALCKFSSAQIICLLCYNQNDSISSGVNNLLLNGSFENTNCSPWPTADVYCPNSSNYSCNIANWSCTGGGSNTYTYIFDITSTFIAEGSKAAYFGNYFCSTCGPISGDTSCLTTVDCSVSGLPPGFPKNDAAYGGANGVSLKQTVNGLTPGDIYVLEFWVGGESFSSFPNKGLFAVDVGFGDTLLRCKPTGPTDIGTVYLVEFIASSSSQTIKFTNWGHICSTCTELILDDVRLYTLAELSPSVPVCQGIFPQSSFASTDSSICEKFCVNFTDQSINAPDSWNWQFPGGNPSSSSAQNPSNVCYNNPGIYDVTLITTNAGGSDTLTLPGFITVHPTPPFPTITQTGYTLTSSPGAAYQWEFNSVEIPGATNQTYDVPQSGYYSVLVTDSNGCSSSAIQYILITGIEDIFSNGNVFIYPNPSKGIVNVEWRDDQINGDLFIEILNTLGQVVFSTEEKNTISHATKTIDVGMLNDGIYILQITASSDLKDDQLFRRKLLITK